MRSARSLLRRVSGASLHPSWAHGNFANPCLAQSSSVVAPCAACMPSSSAYGPMDLGLGSTTASGAPGDRPGARFVRRNLPLLRQDGRRMIPGAAEALWARAGAPRRPGRAVGGCSPCNICRHLDFVMWPMGLCRLVACLMGKRPVDTAAPQKSACLSCRLDRPHAPGTHGDLHAAEPAAGGVSAGWQAR